jgi:endonuclease-3
MKPPRETREILDTLESQHPGADTELHFKTAFELLVATILSAQSTDAGVNLATPALFTRYPDARALANAKHADVEPLIHSTGFFRAKARSIVGMAQALVESHDGEVPATMEALVALPGVGRKTANVVLGHALGIPGLPVDRHVLRVSNRIGIAESDDPIAVEQQLCEAMPPERWTRTSDTLILHGRRICRPKPLCDQCFVVDECDYYRTVVIPEREGRTHGSAPTNKGKAHPSKKPRAVGPNLRVRPDPRRGKKPSRAPRTAKRAPAPVMADPRVRPKKAVAKRRVRKARR